MNAKTEHVKMARQILDFIANRDHFLVSAHINADGDAVASVLAMGMMLEQMGKKYYMVFHDRQIDTRFNYMRGYDRIINFKPELDLNIQAALILDVPGTHRLGDVATLLPEKANIAKIDHHPPEDMFAEVDMCDENASSTTHLIYEIIEEAGMKMDKSYAEAIYTGIVYDTGRFSFSNTTSRDMFIGGKMIDLGADPEQINNRLFFENSFHALRTIGKGLANLESYFDGAVNIIYLDYESMNSSDQSEIEELANYSVAIRGGQVGLFIREVKPSFHKISLRSKGPVDVNQVAKSFDGGGHARAAGCRIEGTKNEVIEMILKVVSDHLGA